MLLYLRVFSLWRCLAALLVAPSTHAQEVPVSFHGSGTTNPSKCYWTILETMMAGMRHPAKLSYRAVGSTTGQAEFINLDGGSIVDFASGDIPIPTVEYNKLIAAGINIVHLPVLLGPVSIFHTVPVLNKAQLNLTSCLLARIFTRGITEWNHSDIVALNPNLVAETNSTITVIVRQDGSSSSSGTTRVSFVVLFAVICIWLIMWAVQS
jgi:ABC-type phosphate transport system substrate-binding protein